jgi:hypothetical protein
MSINLVGKKNREGRVYVYLVEVYRDGDKVKHRRIRSYGRLDKLEQAEPGWFERTKAKLETSQEEAHHIKELVFRFDATQRISDVSKNYGWKIMDDIFISLGLVDVFKTERKQHKLVEVLKLLTYQRVLAPRSKLATVYSQEKMFGKWGISENDIYRGLDKLNEMSEEIQLVLHRNISRTIGRTALLVFYDVTNYYFETDKEDDFKKRGPSKEHQPHPIVQLGLFMDSNGIPISYKLFRGNQTDPITYLPAIAQVKKQFGIERIIVVADKAMNSKNNISHTLLNNDGWLFSQKHRGLRGSAKDIQKFILDPTGWEFNNTMTFAKKSMIRVRELKDGITVKEKVLVTWNKAYAVREKYRRDGALEYANSLTDPELFRQVAKKGGKKYLKIQTINKETGEAVPFSPIIGIDNSKVDFDEQFDGVNVLVTSEINMHDDEILSQYRQLSKIEDCFRITKTDLNARPVYVWTKPHIKAHFLTCFIALIFVRILQNAVSWELSSGKIINALRSATTTEFPNSYEMIQGNDDFVLLNKKLGIHWGKMFIEKEKLTKYAKGWFNTLFPLKN